MDDVNTWEKATADVVKADGAPIVLSRYGFRIEEMDGKTYLIAQTQSELEEQISKLDIEATAGGCYTDSFGNCHSTGCKGFCKLPSAGALYCICIK